MTREIRQSEQWASYLQMIGWQVFTTESGIKVAILKNRLFRFAKVQRPKNLIVKELVEIEKVCQTQKCVLLKIEPNIEQDLTIFTQSGYLENNAPLLVSSTLIIDLTKTEGELWNALSKSAKYSIKRARREKCSVKILNNPNEKTIQTAIKVLKESAKFHHIFNFSQTDVFKRIKAFAPHAYIALSYDEKNNISGANLFLRYENSVWYIQGGTTKLGRKNNTGSLLYWNSILFFKNQGLSQLDLEGILDKRFAYTKSWQGFSYFKQKFGGVKVRYPKPYIKGFNPIVHFLLKITRLSV